MCLWEESIHIKLCTATFLLIFSKTSKNLETFMNFRRANEGNCGLVLTMARDWPAKAKAQLRSAAKVKREKLWELLFKLQVDAVYSREISRSDAYSQQCCGDEAGLPGLACLSPRTPRSPSAPRWLPSSRTGFGARDSGFPKMCPGPTWRTHHLAWNTPSWVTWCTLCLWRWGFYYRGYCLKGKWSFTVNFDDFKECFFYLLLLVAREPVW